MRSRVNSRDLPKPVVERQQYLCLSVNTQSTSLEVALNKTTEGYSTSAILILPLLNMQMSLIYYTQDFRV